MMPQLQRLREVAGLFLKLGLTAFGGPAAHTAMMHSEVVERRRWLSEQEFLDLLGATNLIPGPNSTEMAIHIGMLRAGWAGLLVGGVCFIAPAMFMVLFEDTAAVIGVLIALAGIGASETLGLPVLDGVASIGIGILLAVVAMFLAREAKGLLIGEPAEMEVVKSICAIARAHPGVERSNGLFTVHLGPDQIVAAISVDFVDTLSAADVEKIVAAIEERVRLAHPEIVLLLIKPQSAAAFERTRVGTPVSG